MQLERYARFDAMVFEKFATIFYSGRNFGYAPDSSRPIEPARFDQSFQPHLFSSVHARLGSPVDIWDCVLDVSKVFQVETARQRNVRVECVWPTQRWAGFAGDRRASTDTQSITGMLLFNKGIPLDPRIWSLLPSHIESVLFGWTVQLVMGIAFWIPPRFSKPPVRGNERLVGGLSSSSIWGFGLSGCLQNYS